MSGVLCYPPFVLCERFRVLATAQGSVVLKPREYAVMRALMQAPDGVAMSTMLALIYGERTRPHNATDCVRQVILRLRRGCEQLGEPRLIRTGRFGETVWHLSEHRERAIAHRSAELMEMARQAGHA